MSVPVPNTSSQYRTWMITTVMLITWLLLLIF